MPYLNKKKHVRITSFKARSTSSGEVSLSFLFISKAKQRSTALKYKMIELIL